MRKNIIKSAIFYAVSIVCLFLIESSNELLSRKDNPVVFWSIFVLVILIPIIRFRFYRLFFYCEYGEVTEIKNKRELGAKNKENERATAMYGDITMMGTIEVCVITVRTRRGTYREYTFSRDEETAALCMMAVRMAFLMSGVPQVTAMAVHDSNAVSKRGRRNGVQL